MRPYIYGSQVYVAHHIMDKLEDIFTFLGSRYSFESHIHIAHYVLDRLKNTYKPVGPRNMLHLMFLIE